MSEVSAIIAAGLSTYQVEQQITYSLLAKQADIMRQQGDAWSQLLQSAANLGKAAGKGEVLDLLA